MKYFALIDGITVPISADEFHLEEAKQKIIWGKSYVILGDEIGNEFWIILQSKQVIVREYKPVNQKS